MENSQKVAQKFCCNNCNYECSKKNDFDKHLTTPKHKNRTILNVLEQKVAKSRKIYTCKNCDKSYNARNSLWYHSKNCKELFCKTVNPLFENSNANMNNIITNQQMVIMLMKKNDELQQMMMDVIKNGTHNNVTNSHNKSFNINLFLNETCKDAMNIMDFAESIQLQLNDLMRVGELGYVEGISDIIVKNLKALDVTQRPVHCTDKKRETIYIKDENKWEKDAEQKKMRKLVKKVASKNQRLLPKFKEVHPDCIKSSSQYSDQYNKLIIEAMGGRGDNDYEKEEKIIKNISKAVIVEKDVL